MKRFFASAIVIAWVASSAAWADLEVQTGNRGQPYVATDAGIIMFKLKYGVFDMPQLRNVRSRAVIEIAGVDIQLYARTLIGCFHVREVSDALGPAWELESTWEAGMGVTLTQTFRFHESRRFILMGLKATPPPGFPSHYRIKSLEPIVLEPPLGDYVGRYGRLKVLDNGSHLYLDFLATLYQPGVAPPWPQRLFGHAVRSDYSALAYSWEDGPLLAGFLDAEEAAIITADEKHFIASWIYRPPMPFNREYSSGMLYLDLSAASPFQALEDYGDALGAWHNAKIPDEAPAGWNSWGEYYSDIDEEIALANLDFAAENYRPFGMKYFMIDSGYSPYWGDWVADSQRFPHGLGWLADRIREKGMIPGIWLAPFEADVNSQTFRDHPGWFLKAEGVRDRLLLSGGNAVLDLGNPEVKEHLREVIRRYVKDYGFRWLKIDFAYRFMMHKNSPAEDKTLTELYRAGMKIIREEAGPEVFICGIGLAGMNYGLVDGDRITLDNMPGWNNQRSWMKGTGFVQGLVPTARNVSRRYWLNRRLWINHPDLIFFNNDRWPGWASRPLEFNESLAFASLVGLSGGIVKIGDKMVDMAPREVDVIQRILPAIGGVARPVDLFEMETPEVWSVKYNALGEEWRVIGLFNWGENWKGGKHIAESEREIGAGFTTLGLEPATTQVAFDFWNEQLIGEVREKLILSVPPRSARIVCLRPLLDHPFFLSCNRHISQGAVDIKLLEWKEETLRGEMKTVPGHRYHLHFYCPAPWQPGISILLGGASGDREELVAVEGPLITLSFTASSKTVQWGMGFSR